MGHAEVVKSHSAVWLPAAFRQMPGLLGVGHDVAIAWFCVPAGQPERHWGSPPHPASPARAGER